MLSARQRPRLRSAVHKQRSRRLRACVKVPLLAPFDRPAERSKCAMELCATSYRAVAS